MRPGELVTICELIDELWPANPPESALANARMYVANLRRTFDCQTPGIVAVERRGPGYLLIADPSEIDYLAFRRFVISARDAERHTDAVTAANRYKDALALWQGPALADVPLGAQLTARRAALAEEYIAAVEELALVYLSLDRTPAVVTLMREQTAAHPLRERGWELLMTAQYRTGDVCGALATYRAARTALVDGLGIEPGPALRALQRSILGSRRAGMRCPVARGP